jgi:hypothetical protein
MGRPSLKGAFDEDTVGNVLVVGTAGDSADGIGTVLNSNLTSVTVPKIPVDDGDESAT